MRACVRACVREIQVHMLDQRQKHAHLAPVVKKAHIEELFKSPTRRLVCKQLRELLFDRIHLNTQIVLTCMHAYDIYAVVVVIQIYSNNNHKKTIITNQ